MALKLSYLQYFQVVCKHCNLSRAAEELYVSQPTLSHAMNDLESEFGVALFTRQRNGLTLTKDGKKLMELSAGLLQHADEVSAQMKHISVQVQPLRLGLPPVIGSLIFPQVFRLVQHYAPAITFDVTEIGSASGLPLLLDGSLEAAIISHTEPLSGAYDSLPLRRVPIVLYISIENPAASLDTFNFGDVPDLPLVLLKKDSFITTYIKKQYKSHNVEPRVVLETNNLHAIRNMLDYNSAASFLYEGTLSNAEENIVTIPIENHTEVQISFVWNKKKKKSRELSTVIRTLKAHLAEEVPEN